MSYIKVSEAAERLGVSSQTIHNWISWGVLQGYGLYRNPVSQRAGFILVREEDLDENLGVFREVGRRINDDDESYYY